MKKVEKVKKLRKSESFKDNLNNVYSYVNYFQVQLKEEISKKNPQLMKEFNLEEMSKLINS